MTEEQKTGQAVEAELKATEATQPQAPDITIKEEELPPAPEQISINEADLPPQIQITEDDINQAPAAQPNLVITDEDLAQAPARREDSSQVMQDLVITDEDLAQVPAPQPDLVITDDDLAQAPGSEATQAPQQSSRLRRILGRLSGNQ